MMRERGVGAAREGGDGLPDMPWWVIAVHLLFLAFVVAQAHYPALFVAASVAGPFVHGSFATLGETVQALYVVEERQRPLLGEMVRRQVITIQLAYAPMLLAVVVASGWASYAILAAPTRVPVWMSAVNPVTMTLAWLAVKAVLPQRAGAMLHGAGFNIAYFAWFAALAAAVA